MPFTLLFAALAVLTLTIIFGVTFKLKGLKIALLATGAAFVLFAALFMALLYAIVGSM